MILKIQIDFGFSERAENILRPLINALIEVANQTSLYVEQHMYPSAFEEGSMSNTIPPARPTSKPGNTPDQVIQTPKDKLPANVHELRPCRVPSDLYPDNEKGGSNGCLDQD